MRRLFSALILLCACAAMAAQTFDLRPYGFKPTRNETYRPRENSTAVQYLPDGSLVVAFHSRGMVAGAKSAAARNLAPVELVRLDAASGKLLARARALVDGDVRYLWPAGDGVLVFSGAKIVLLGPDLKLRREISVEHDVSAVGVVAPLRALAVYLHSQDLTQWVQLIDLQTLSISKTYEIVNGQQPVFLRNGYAVVAHDKDGARYLRVREGTNEHRVSLPALPCRTLLQELNANAVVALTCEKYQVVSGDGSKIMEGQLRSDEDAPQVFAADGAPRFGLAAIAGFAGYPRDQQRIYGREFRVFVFDLEQKNKVFTTKISPLPKLGGTFALSPDGHRLAVIKDGEVTQFAVP